MTEVDRNNEYIKANWTKKSDAEIAAILGISKKAVSSRRARMHLTKTGGPLPEDLTAEAETNAIAQFLQEKGITADNIGNVSQVKLSSWGSEEKPQTSTSVVLKLSPKWEDGPEWPLVQPADPVVIKPFNVLKEDRKVKRAVILPDVQIGYRLLRDWTLDPFHDERAMGVALSILKDLNPDLVINLGDYMDFAEFGRFTQEMAFAHTTQESVNRGHDFLAEQIANAPNAEEYVVMEGNHDRRLPNMIQDNAKSAYALQQANAPESWPVLSVPHLLRFDELGITYVDGYPAGEYYINDRIRVEHGSKTGPRGKIAAKMVADERISVITGHTHRIEEVYKTTNVRDGGRVNAAYTMGCLCRIDGAVPSTNGSTDSLGNPVLKYEDWQQAVGIVEYVPGDGPFNVRTVLIHEGEAVFNGKLYSA